MARGKPAGRSGAAAPANLAAQLGAGARLWDELVAHIESVHAPVTREWKPASKAGGWYLRLARRKRTILYLLPREGHFLTAFVFGEKAAVSVRASDVPATVIQALNEARPYVEGRGIRIETRTPADVATMKILAAIKMRAP